MEYLVFGLAIAALVLILFVTEAVRARKEQKEFIRDLYDNYGRLNQKKYTLDRFAKMGSFFDKHRKEGQLDDITWNDLGMDELFKRMNYALSASGEEYLYYTLRTPKQDEGELEHLETVVCFFGEHPDIRVQVQCAMGKLGHMGKFSLYDYLDNLDALGERSNRKHISMDLLFLPFIGLLWVNFSLGILGIVVLTIVNIISYFKEKGEIDPYITSFSYIMRLMQAGRELEKMPVPVCGREWEELRRTAKQLQGMKSQSFWVMSPLRGNASGDVLAILLDYVRMVFHVDLIKFNTMLRLLRGHMEDVDALIQVAGYVETAISIWEFRKSLEVEGENTRESLKMLEAENGNPGEFPKKSPGGHPEMELGESPGWCVPEFISGGRIEILEGYHPLLSSPVKNGICADRGVLLTGSNASGKSTFLKMVALNAILAQTTHTCAADKYRASFFHIYSSMALRDDMASGESYYIVEIKALKRILDAAAEGSVAVLCFVDEVLRGTNTVERIAASTQILKSLSGSGILCFAATHDIELTELLRNEFDNYHFEEDVRDGDVFFNYRLKSGKATTRNAIKLLSLMGYDPAIIERASAQAEHFSRSGVWEAS